MPSWFKIVNLYIFITFFSNTVAQIQIVICGVILEDLIQSGLRTYIALLYCYFLLQ